MKKILLIAAVASIAMVSCKKEKTCTCTNTSTAANGTVTVGTPQVTVYKKISGSDAKNVCATSTNENTSTYTNNGTSVSSTTKNENKCELK